MIIFEFLWIMIDEEVTISMCVCITCDQECEIGGRGWGWCSGEPGSGIIKDIKIGRLKKPKEIQYMKVRCGGCS